MISRRHWFWKCIPAQNRTGPEPDPRDVGCSRSGSCGTHCKLAEHCRSQYGIRYHECERDVLGSKPSTLYSEYLRRGMPMRYQLLIQKLAGIGYQLWLRHGVINRLNFDHRHSSLFRLQRVCEHLMEDFPESKLSNKARNLLQAGDRCQRIMEGLPPTGPYWEFPPLDVRLEFIKQCKRNGIRLEDVAHRCIHSDVDW